MWRFMKNVSKPKRVKVKIKTPNDSGLFDADPNCKHVIDYSGWSGIKCKKCNGWFCY